MPTICNYHAFIAILIFICACICISITMCVCMQFLCIYLCGDPCGRVCRHICTYVRTCIYVCMYACMMLMLILISTLLLQTISSYRDFHPSPRGFLAGVDTARAIPYADSLCSTPVFLPAVLLCFLPSLPRLRRCFKSGSTGVRTYIPRLDFARRKRIHVSIMYGARAIRTLIGLPSLYFFLAFRAVPRPGAPNNPDIGNPGDGY